MARKVIKELIEEMGIGNLKLPVKNNKELLNMSKFELTIANIKKMCLNAGECFEINGGFRAQSFYNKSIYMDFFPEICEYHNKKKKEVYHYVDYVKKEFEFQTSSFLQESELKKFIQGRGRMLQQMIEEKKRENKISDNSLWENICNNYKEQSLKELSAQYNIISDEPSIIVPGEIDIKKDLPIDVVNNVKIQHLDESKLLCSDVLLATSDKIVGHFVLQEVGDDLFLTCSAQDYNIEGISNKKFTLNFKEYNGDKIFCKPIDINYQNKLEETNSVLCIDFGTSNSTVGAYLTGDYIQHISDISINNGNVKLEQINYVKFFYEDNGSNQRSFIVPSIVYIDSCVDTKNVKYLFGYDAEKKLKDNDYCPTSSCLLEIKRWTNDYKNEYEIEDSDGNVATITKGEIIGKYLIYLIKQAEVQFNCRFKNVHITTPVKLKDKSLDIYDEILKPYGYSVIHKNSIDEGVSVLYYLIDNEIDTGSYKANQKNTDERITQKALIMDCGGGTTDIASCEYTISQMGDMLKLKLATEYLNGDVNFGGNNLTYRIMQYMKIRYVDHYNSHFFDDYKKRKGKCFSIDDLIETSSDEIFAQISEDTEQNNKVADRYAQLYEKFNEIYEKAEEIIPTKFTKYKGRPKDEVVRVKNNFYFLWKIAEHMKEEFFKHTNLVHYSFDKRDKDDKILDSDTDVGRINKWPLSVRESVATGKLVDKEEVPNVKFSTLEIGKLLQGDIFYLVYKFFFPLFNDNRLSSYNKIKLSGQSTQIGIFQDALKEFLPGLKIKRFKSDKDRKSFEEKKLACLNGAISYLNNKENGKYEVEVVSNTKCIPIDAFYNKSASASKIFFTRGEDWKQPPVIQQITSSQSNFIISSMTQDNVKNDNAFRYVINHEEEYKEINIDELKTLLHFEKIQDILQKMEKDYTYIIVGLNQEKWGFDVMLIKKDDNERYWHKTPQTYQFEQDFTNKPISGIINQNEFFDGLK